MWEGMDQCTGLGSGENPETSLQGEVTPEESSGIMKGRYEVRLSRKDVWTEVSHEIYKTCN